MQLKPNKTPITATVISPRKEDNTFDIVILSIAGQIVLPAFLWTGKIVNILKIISDKDIHLKEGQIISTKIEVMGDPFTQKYYLHNIVISGVNDSEEQS
ncbi:MAG: hypothetical protein ACI86M_002563 [Saprospiraceae bacterium]|jgi:hypothetical protein